MARTSVVIDRNDWQGMFDSFCDEVYHKIRKPIPYQNFRKIKDGPITEAQISVYDDKSIEVYNIGCLGHKDFDMYKSTIEDGSFGSYLYDYFQEVLKPMDEEKREYDIWGLADKVNESCSAYCTTNSTSGLVTNSILTTTDYTGDYLKTGIQSNITKCNDNRKEKENMDTNKMFNNFEFGPADDRVKMSPYGMAIRNADGRYVSYDPKTGNIVDVEVFNFDNHNLIYKMPVAVSAIAVGDTVIHMKKPMFVTSVTNGITVIDIFNGEVKTIMPATNMFGFNFVTKVVSLFNFTDENAPSAENPFGNILPFMLMGSGSKDFKDILPLMLMTGNTAMFNNMTQNPLMLYALMSDKNNIDPMLIACSSGWLQLNRTGGHENK